jgi:hypothetical protein
LTFNLPANAIYSLVVFVAGVGSGSLGWAEGGKISGAGAAERAITLLFL